MLCLLLKKNTFLIIKQACSPIIYHVVKKSPLRCQESKWRRTPINDLLVFEFLISMR